MLGWLFRGIIWLGASATTLSIILVMYYLWCHWCHVMLMPLTSHDTNTSVNDTTWLKSIQLTKRFQLPWPKECSCTIVDVSGVSWCWCHVTDTDANGVTWPKKHFTSPSNCLDLRNIHGFVYIYSYIYTRETHMCTIYIHGDSCMSTANPNACLPTYIHVYMYTCIYMHTSVHRHSWMSVYM